MIILKELTLTNYRNIKHQVLKFDGNSKVVGENRIGKTNTIEALYWLLTDKLLNGSKDIDQIKPLNDTKAVVQVSALFDVDGKEIALGKEYKEEWVKTRGTDELVFKGHTTTYIYNNIKQGTKKEYDSLVAADFGINAKAYQGIDVMQMLVNPLYLGRMGDTDDWKNLRTMIIDIVGDVKDEDVFNQYPKLKAIAPDMERSMGRTDQVIKGYRDQVKSLKEDIIGKDANIQMLENTEKPLDESFAIAKRGIEECEERFRTLKVDVDEQVFIEIDREIMDLKNQIIDIKRKDLEKKQADPNEAMRKNLTEEKDKLYNDAQNLVVERSKAIDKYFQKKSQVDTLQKQIDEEKVNRLNLLDEIHALDKQLEHPEFEKECPHCHRPYDISTIEESIATVTKSLHEKRSSILIKGKQNTDSMKGHELELEVAKKELEELDLNKSRIEDSVKVINSKLEDMNKQLEELRLEPEKDFINPKITELEDKIKAKEDEKAAIRSDNQKKEDSVRSLISDLQARKEKYQRVIDDYNFWTRSQEQIAKVKAEKKELTTQLITLEQKVELVNAFIKAKLEMLDENIKKVFGDVSFQLIEPQVNGGYSTVCKPYIKGTHTLWKSGSKSERVVTGIAIAEKIKEKLGLPNLPYLFDEGGEISTDTFSTRFKTESQLICVKIADNINSPLVQKI